MIPLFVFLGVISAATCLAGVVLSRNSKNSKDWFLLADRQVSLPEGACSIAAAWVWAPALFLSTQMAYQHGILGFLWFLIPNVASLVFFSIFARRIRRWAPHGVTLSDLIRERYSSRVRALYWIALIGLALGAFTVQLLAAAQLLAGLLGLPHFITTLALGLFPLSYTLIFGLRASLFSDSAKLLLIFFTGLLLVPPLLQSSGGFAILVKGLPGTSGTLNPLSKESANLFWSFGLPATIGLLCGPFGDQTFWQRAFSIQRTEVSRAFLFGALLFALVPILMALFGFIAAGIGLRGSLPEFIAMDLVRLKLPPLAATALLILMLSGLLSILDSKLTSVSTLGGHDFANLASRNGAPGLVAVLFGSRLAMILLALSGIALANIPGLRILPLFLLYGTLRASIFLPTLLALLGAKLREGDVFYGILTGMLVGFPLFAWGNFRNQARFVVIGSLISLLSTGFFVLARRCIGAIQPQRQAGRIPPDEELQ